MMYQPIANMSCGFKFFWCEIHCFIHTSCMVLYAKNIVKYLYFYKTFRRQAELHIFPSSNKSFPERSVGNTIFPLIKKKKKFENFLKQLGDSPEKKRNISANVSAYALRNNVEWRIRRVVRCSKNIFLFVFIYTKNNLRTK